MCALGLYHLYPATPGWGVRRGCVCLGPGFGCAPPLLAGVSGFVCACVRAPLAPRHSWLGCAAWVSVFGLGFPLRPAIPGWGVGVCVYWCARCSCTPPLLAGVCVVGAWAWVRVSAAPRHSWLGCWGVCVLVCALRLYPATPGWGVRCACACLGSGLGCAPPLLAGVLGCVCVRVGGPPLPRHSWLGCAVWVCVLGLWFRLRPATPGWGVGVCVCWCVRSSSTPPLLAGVCGVPVCVCVRAPLVPRHSWLGCAVWLCVFQPGFRLPSTTPGWGVGVCVFVCLLPLFPATPGCSVRRECVCLGSGFVCAPPPLAGVLGCVCAGVRAPLVPRHSWLGCAVWVCVFWLGFRLRPATPGWGVGMCVFVCVLPLYPATPGWGTPRGCVCSGSGLGCAPPLLAGVLGCVCAGVGPPLVVRQSWLGCAVWVWVFGLGFWLRPATPGWGVGVCVFVCVLPLYPPTPGWGVRRVCVCSGSGLGRAPPLLAWVFRCTCCCACSPCTPPLLAGACGVGVRVWIRVSAAPRHSLLLLGCVCGGVGAPLVPQLSWLGCAVWMCVFGLGFQLRPATPGWGLGVCVLVWVLPLYPATPGWGVRRVCVCLGLGFGCAPPLLAWVLRFVCAGVRASFVPCHSWLGFAVWMCVVGLGSRLRPATPGWGVELCVCWCSCSACSLPLLAGVCGVDVCGWALVSATPRHTWLGCWSVCVLVCLFRLYPATPGWDVRRGCVCLGSDFVCAPPLLAGSLCCVCAGVRIPPVPRQSWLGCALWVCVLGLGFGLSPVTPGWGLQCVGWLLHGISSCAVVCSVFCALPGFAAPGGRFGLAPVLVPWLWPAACLSRVPCGPALVRRASSRPVALGAPVGFPVAVVPFPTPWACAPGFTGWLRGARGGRPRTRLIVPAAGPRRGRGAGLAQHRTRSGPRHGVVPGGSLRRRSWAACAAVVCVSGPGH